ncbi:MAG: ABC transporter permease [Arachnia sp.]
MSALAIPLPRHRESGRRPIGAPLALIGVAAAIGVWWLITLLFADRPLVGEFTPARTFTGLTELAASGTLVDASAVSIFRLLVGIGLAAAVGVVIGFAVGSIDWLERASSPVLLFLRMVSPLSWAPIAILAFGIGAPPVVALVMAAAVWPVQVATAEGVRRIEPGHRLVAHALGATGWEVARHVVIPALRPSVLVGLRQAIGIGWVVLVPAEMLGVTSGLGYQIMNAKDQLAYHHITALIIVIGALGFALDVLARWAFASRRERAADRQPA